MADIAHYLSSFFPHHMRRQMKELYVSTLILNMGIMMIQLFEPIYLYTLGYSLREIMLFFLIVYAVYFFVMPLGANFARHFGYEKAIAVSTVIFILYYLVFYFIGRTPELFYVAPFLYALQKMFYWPAFHADFARFAKKDEDSREIGGISVAIALVSIAGPLAAGIILEVWGFGALFAIASFLFLLSNIPLLTTKEIFVPKPFRYFETYRQLFSRENRRALFAYMGYGEELVVMVVWPVFMAIVVVDLLNVGAIASFATLLTMLVTIMIGRSSDKGNKRAILGLGTVIYAISWFVRLIVGSTFGVVVVDSLSRITKNMIGVPLLAITYEQAKQRSVMQTIVFFESSLVVGKLAALAVILLLLSFVPDALVYQVAFVVAGFMTFLYALI